MLKHKSCINNLFLYPCSGFLVLPLFSGRISYVLWVRLSQFVVFLSCIHSIYCLYNQLSCYVLCRNLSDVLVEAISNRKVLSLYQGLGTKNLQSFIAQFVYFYGYSYFKKLYLKKSGVKYIGTKANLLIAAAAGSCTALITQVRNLVLPLSSPPPPNPNII